MNRSRVFALLTASVVVSGCQYIQQKQAAADQALAARVRAALVAEPQLDPSRITVAAEHREVRLLGSVKSLQEAAQALAVAQKASGRRVVASALAVKPSP
jgi:osmotically-inducible protein OsmY